MHAILLETLLCCPVDRAFPLAVEGAVWDGPSLQDGYLRCPACEARYPVIAGIPHMLPPNKTEPADTAAARRRELEARNHEARRYDAEYAELVSTAEHAAELEALLGGLRIVADDVVLDLGAGTGRLTTALAALGATVVAMDLASHALELNRSKCAPLAGQVHHLVADACHVPLRDGSATKAISAQMLEHIAPEAARRQCVGEVRRVLKSGGALALTTYNYSWSKRRRGTREGYHDPERQFYYYRYDRDGLRALLQPDFKVRRLTGIRNLPDGLDWAPLDRVIAAVPPIAGQTADLLLAVAQC